MEKKDEKTEEVVPIESGAVRIFRAKCEAAMEKILNYKQWEEEEEIVHEVMVAGRKLFDKPLDQMSPDFLLRLGGRLSGAYVYIGQKSAYARAERDVYEQKLDEMKKAYVLEKLKDDPKYKVTQANSEASEHLSELVEFVIQKETAKNQWENLLEACDKMISFCQSAIKVKEGERFQAGRISNQN